MEKLRTLLEQEHSKKQKDLIVKEIIAGNIQVSDAVKTLVSNDGIYAQRVAYVITGLTDEAPHLLNNHLNELWKAIQPTSHDAIPRCVYRHFALTFTPKDLMGVVFEEGSKTFMKKTTPIAIKAHIMGILTEIARQHTELKDEVIYLISEQLEGATPGYISRANKELKKLKQL